MKVKRKSLALLKTVLKRMSLYIWPLYDHFWPFFRHMYVHLSRNWGHFEVLNRSYLWLVQKRKYFNYQTLFIDISATNFGHQTDTDKIGKKTRENWWCAKSKGAPAPMWYVVLDLHGGPAVIMMRWDGAPTKSQSSRIFQAGGVH